MAQRIQSTVARLAAVAAIVLAGALPARAQEQPPELELDAPGVVHLSASERAPFTGMLIQTEDLVRWRLEIERLRQQLAGDADMNARRLTLLERRAAVDLEACEARLTLHTGLYEARIREVATEMAQQSANDRRAIRRLGAWSVLWFVAGAIVGSVVTVTVR